MLTWMVALAAGAAAVAAVYGRGLASAIVPAALRFVAVSGLVALLLNAVLGGRRPAPPIVALDVSASWARSGDSTLFAETLRRARAAARGDLILFGDSARVANGDVAANDRASLVRPVVERALAGGRPVSLFTDGEIDDAQALAGVLGGSHVAVVRGDERPDAGLVEIVVPRSAVGGDTIDIDVRMVAGGVGAPSGRVAFLLGDDPAGSVGIDSIGPHGERVVRHRLTVPRANGALALHAVLQVPGDAVSQNDSLTTVVDVLPGAAAVVVSTAPDYDVRDLASVLRGTVLLPTRGFYRVAAGRWREDGSLGAVSEADVRRAAAEAPLLILHGDTALFGDPRALGRGALLLVAPPPGESGEWYATGAPASPMATALSGSPWDSLPPLDVAMVATPAAFEVLESRRARRLERRAVALGWERPRRVVLVPAAGFWRWRFRGGSAAAVHAAFWGSVIDWLAADRADGRGAIPVSGSIREGEVVRWRRGSATDSVVRVALSRPGVEQPDTLTLRFPDGALHAETAPRDRGLYEVSTTGGRTLLAVNPSTEVLPRRPTVTEGDIGSGEAFTEAKRLRGMGWIFGIVILALCAEWILRRNRGLR
jgi:hypothetical protein